MHQALYRKWRPKSFADVCGQDHITDVLRYEVENNAVNHAYLFCGSRGTGKTTCAKILAKAVNCEHPQSGSPCGTCASCRAIDAGSATDVLEMDAASNNGVENIRDIRDEVVYSPSALRYRVYIVDEVHMLSASAFNALLKTLEEPPAHVIFILATTELQKLPATIISRCQRFDFRRISVPALSARISYIAGQEGITLLPGAAERIARFAQGGMRDAISLLELCAGTRKEISTAIVDEMMGSAGRETMIGLLRAVKAGDCDALFAAVDDAVNSSRDLSVFWQDLLLLYRDLLVMKATDSAGRYLDLTDAEATELSALAAMFTKSELLSHCRLVEEGLFAMQRANAVKRVVAELTLMRLCDPRLDTSPEGLLQRIERLENRSNSFPDSHGTEGTPKPVVSKAPADGGKTAEPALAEKAGARSPGDSPPAVNRAVKGNGRTLRRIRGFADCVERIRQENAMTASFLSGAKAFLDESDTVILQLPHAFAGTMLAGQGEDMLYRALSAELHREIDAKNFRMEFADEKPAENDTVIDDLLKATKEDTAKP